MIDKKELEYLKQQVTYSPGATQEARERWYIIVQLHELKRMLRSAEQGLTHDK